MKERVNFNQLHWLSILSSFYVTVTVSAAAMLHNKQSFSTLQLYMGLLLWDMQKKYPGWSATYSKHYIVCIVHLLLNKLKERKSE